MTRPKSHTVASRSLSPSLEGLCPRSARAGLPGCTRPFSTNLCSNGFGYQLRLCHGLRGKQRALPGSPACCLVTVSEQRLSTYWVPLFPQAWLTEQFILSRVHGTCCRELWLVTR